MQQKMIRHLGRVCLLAMIVGALGIVASVPAQQQTDPQTDQLLSLLAEGDLRYIDRDFEQSLRLYETAARLAPDSPQVRHRLRLAQQREAARQRFLLTVPAEPSAREAFVEQHYSEAIDLYNEHRLAAAHQRFEEVHFAIPGHRRVESYLERVERELALISDRDLGGSSPAAELNLPNALNSGPGYETILVTPGLPTHDSLMSDGEQLMEQGSHEGAYETFTRALMTDPNSRSAQRARDRAARAIERSQTQALQGEIDSAETLVERGLFDDARAAYTEILQANPDNDDAQAGIVDLERAQAAAQLAEREQLIASNVDVGRNALRANELEAAQAAYESILVLDSGNRTAQRGLANVEVAREEQAANALNQIVSDHVAQGEAAIANGDFEAAREAAAAIVALEADRSEGSRLLAQIERAESQAERAAREAEQARVEREQRDAAEQRDAMISQTLRDGRTALRGDEFGEAIRNAETVLALDPSNSTARRLREDAVAERDAQAMAQQRTQQLAAEQELEDQIEGILDEAQDQLDDESYADALATAQSVFELQVDNADAQRLINRIQEEQQEAQIAAVADEQRELSDRIRGLERDARRALRRDNYADAIQIAEQIRALDANNEDAQGIIADAQAGIAEDAEDERQDRIESLLDTARDQARDGQTAEAVATAQRVFDLDEGNAAAQRLISDAQEAELEMQTEAAEAQLVSQIRDLLDTAENQRDAGELEAARATLQEAAALDPDNRSIQRGLRRVEGDISEQAEDLEENAEDALSRAERAMARERYDEAVSQYEAALALMPGLAAASQGLEAAQAAQAAEQAAVQNQDAADQKVADGVASLEAGNLDAAEAAFNEALALVPNLDDAEDGLRDLQRARNDAAEVAEREAEIAAQAEQRELQRRSESLVDDAEEYADAGRLDMAEQSLREALTDWPENDDARDALREIDEMRREEEAAQAEVAMIEADALIQGLLLEARQAYSDDDVIGAVDKWRRVIEIDPNNEFALVSLGETEDEYATAIAALEAEAEMTARVQEMENRLDTPISITTPSEGTPLQTFLTNISVFTDLDFVTADGVDVQITGSFLQKPLRDVLDAIITANGLQWTVEESIVTIRPNFLTRLYQLSPDDAASLAVFRENGYLDRLLYPPDGVSAVTGQSYELDNVTGTLVITGSQEQIDRIEDLVGSLPGVSPNVMEVRIFRIRENEGERIMTLITQVLETERTPQTEAFERQIFLEEDNLIVRATPGELRRVEELLSEFGPEGRGLEELGLGIRTFSLIPRRVLQQDEQVARDLAEQIKESVEVLLYARVGAEAARREGRRMWFDEFTLQLTITDTPENLSRVTRYIQSIPQLEVTRTTRIVNLDHQLASTLASKLEDFLGIEIRGASGGGTSAGGAQGESVTRTLRADDEFTFRDIRITLIEVEENDIDDDRDEDITILIDTSTTSEERTIEELRSEIIDNYRIRVLDARAGSQGRSNSGRAEVEITYLGEGGGRGAGGADNNARFQAIPATGGDGGEGGADGEGANATVEDDTVPVVQPDDDTNSLLISVVRPGDLELIEDAIELLDTPILQAQIETKFVEINENRARELKSELQVLNLQDGVTFDNALLSGGFAQDSSEYRSLFEPSLESPINANLPKGTTVLSLITGGSSPLSMELAFLEAEGVISTVNGPFVTAQNNQGADFEIRQEFGNMRTLGAVSGSSGGSGGGDSGGGGTSGGSTSGAAGNGANLLDVDMVIMDVTPTISQSGFITLDIDVEIRNFSNALGQVVGPQEVFFPFPGPVIGPTPEAATINYFGLYSANAKELQTTARIRDGGTIILGGWTLERVTQTSSGVPVLRNLPYIGQLFFSRNQDLLERTTLMIFLTSKIIDIV